MSELTTNLNNILDIKGNIKSAIENKGVDMTGVSFPGYASKIGEISGGGGWDQKSFTEGTIEIINLDNSASFVASSAFKGNTTIQTVNLPYVTTVGNSAFQNCSSLSKVSLPMCSSIGIRAFNNCSSLSQISLPMCNYIDTYTFNNCRSLSQLSLPVCSYIGSNAFRACPILSLSLPVCSYIGGFAFYDCSSLSIITIGYSGICSLGDAQIFELTQITSSTGSIYVPASLVDEYKVTLRWSNFSTQIFPIPE